jgi:hypothetical protein
MAMIQNETRTQPGTCPVHGRVDAEKQLPKLQFPFFVTAPARMLASSRPYHCPACGSAVAPA